MKRLGFVDVDNGWKWLGRHERYLVNEKWNGRENKSGRKCFWLGCGVELGNKNRIFDGGWITGGLDRRINEIWGGDDWNSLLLYKYDFGCELKDHIDRKIFDERVIIINFCQENVDFRYGGKVESLSDGEIIEIDGSVKHGVRKVKDVRYSLSIRKVIG
jgi:hypothetical protein